MQLNDYAKYIDALHTLALIEDDLRTVAAHAALYYDAPALATRVLWERLDSQVG